MASMDEFESTLKEVVHAKRLSASKMGKLTDIALKTMENDTQLVSILYRTHKTLPTAAKVASLYAFDALARAARHQTTKHGYTADSQSGNCATFLLKLESVLEGLFQDMMVTGTAESKEKTKKIYDIWVKGNTFPSTILSRLSNVLKEKEKVPVPEVKTLNSSDPRSMIPPTGSNTTPPLPIYSPVNAAQDPQAALLALLTQAANSAITANTVQTSPNTDSQSQLDAAQLAVLKQLAQSAASPQGLRAAPTTVPHVVPSSSTDSSSHSPPHRDESHDFRNKYPRNERFRNADFDNTFDDRTNMRGRGGFRGRGRGDKRRWDDRASDRHRALDRDSWSPSHRGGRSRSRSPTRNSARSRSKSPPSRYGGRREVHNSTLDPTFGLGSRPDPNGAGSNDIEKDEFGRDIRPQSPNDMMTTPKPTNAALHHPPNDKESVESSLASPSNHEQESLSPVAGNTSPNKPSPPFVSSTVSSPSGMENFDLASFDLTSPSSWEALGKRWQVTNGYMPTTEQLMQFVMSVGNGQSNQFEGYEQNQNPTPAFGQGRGGSRGKGGFTRGRGYGKARVVQGWNQSSNEAETLEYGGMTGSYVSHEPTTGDSHDDMLQKGSNSSTGGKMQRVGDKWVFVRDPGIS